MSYISQFVANFLSQTLNFRSAWVRLMWCFGARPRNKDKQTQTTNNDNRKSIPRGIAEPLWKMRLSSMFPVEGTNSQTEEAGGSKNLQKGPLSCANSMESSQMLLLTTSNLQAPAASWTRRVCQIIRHSARKTALSSMLCFSHHTAIRSAIAQRDVDLHPHPQFVHIAHRRRVVDP